MKTPKDSKLFGHFHKMGIMLKYVFLGEKTNKQKPKKQKQKKKNTKNHLELWYWIGVSPSLCLHRGTVRCESSFNSMFCLETAKFFTVAPKITSSPSKYSLLINNIWMRKTTGSPIFSITAHNKKLLVLMQQQNVLNGSSHGF